MKQHSKSTLRLTLILGITALLSPALASAEGQDSLAQHLLDEVVISGYVPQRMTAPSGQAPVSLTWLTARNSGSTASRV